MSAKDFFRLFNAGGKLFKLEMRILPRIGYPAQNQNNPAFGTLYMDIEKIKKVLGADVANEAKIVEPILKARSGDVDSLVIPVRGYTTADGRTIEPAKLVVLAQNIESSTNSNPIMKFRKKLKIPYRSGGVDVSQGNVGQNLLKQFDDQLEICERTR